MEKMLTKEEEIRLFNELISKFPAGSYVGTWLRQVSPEVIRDIQSDIFPSATPSDLCKQALEVVALAKEQAKIIVAGADKQSGDMIRAARQQAQEIRAVAEQNRHAAIASARRFIEALI